MTADGYPFADGDRLEDRNTYFYTPYGGQEFLDAWRIQRGKVLEVLSDPTEPVCDVVHDFLETGSVKTAALLDGLYSALIRGEAETSVLKEWLYKVVRKFETTKRIHPDYDAQFLALDRTAYHDLSLYVRLAEVFEAAYENTKVLIFLNALLKCVDTLCSIKDRLSGEDQSRLAWLIGRENDHIDGLTGTLAIR